MQVKEIEVSILMDLYKNLLTEKQHTVMEMYYDLDYSLTEIAENEGVTRQGVLDIIKRSKDKLYEFETKLGLYSKFRATESSLAEIEALAGSGKNGDAIRCAVKSIRSAWEE